jgi:hypothetical protein
MRRHTAGYDVLFFIAIFATVIALGGAQAHLFEMPRKLMLSGEDYFTVQQIYAGWDLFGVVLVIQFLSLALLARRSFREYFVFRPVLAALLLMIAAQVIFWLFTFPANAATQNWTQMPVNWEMLRRQWEYSHAAGAICQLLGLCSLVWALFARVRAAGR